MAPEALHGLASAHLPRFIWYHFPSCSLPRPHHPSFYFLQGAQVLPTSGPLHVLLPPPACRLCSALTHWSGLGSKQWFSTGGHVPVSGDILGGQGFYSLSSNAQYSPTTENHPAPNVSNAKTEKLWLNVKVSALLTLLFLLFSLITSPASPFSRMT